MSDRAATVSIVDDTELTPDAGYLATLTRVARRLARSPPCSDRAAFARSIDAVLVRVACGRGALDTAIGERLDALHVRGHALRLGYSTDGAYVRERLGESPSSAQKLCRFSRALRERPLLRAEVRSGRVTRRQAEAVLPVAVGDDEALWVERARTATVRALREAVRNVSLEEDDDEPWRLFVAEIPDDYRDDVADVTTRAYAPFTAATIRADRVRAVCEETLSELAAFAPEPRDDGGPDEVSAEKFLEETTAQWAFLDAPEEVAAPGPLADFDADARQLDEELRGYYAVRDRWDEQLGRLALMFRNAEGWRWLGFASFDHYCAERLGMHPKTVRQRASLERHLAALPSLREARRRGDVSYEKARLIVQFAPDDADRWIEPARVLPCSSLRRMLQQEADRKMCARGSFRAFLPRSVRLLFAVACNAVRGATGQSLSTSECYGRMCRRFREAWPEPRVRSTVQMRVRERDHYLCQVPGCSRAVDHVHHIRHRSRGGSDDPWNLVSLCAAHHLAVHMGWIRVSGRAPDKLHWQLGVRAGVAPLCEFDSRADGPAVLVREAG